VLRGPLFPRLKAADRRSAAFYFEQITVDNKYQKEGHYE